MSDDTVRWLLDQNAALVTAIRAALDARRTVDAWGILHDALPPGPVPDHLPVGNREVTLADVAAERGLTDPPALTDEAEAWLLAALDASDAAGAAARDLAERLRVSRTVRREAERGWGQAQRERDDLICAARKALGLVSVTCGQPGHQEAFGALADVLDAVDPNREVIRHC